MQSVREYLELCFENDLIDLQALIMFLVFEKKVIDLDDEADKLSYYLQPKFKTKMNAYLVEYKKKMNMTYKPNAYQLYTGKETLYIKATSAEQASVFARREGYEVISIAVALNEQAMVIENEQGEVELKTTIGELLNQTSQTPAMLGGYE